MRGGFVGSICFLAFLLSAGTTGQDIQNSQDLQLGNAASNTNIKGAYEAKSEQESIDAENANKEARSSDIGHFGNYGYSPYSFPGYGSSSSAQANALAQTPTNTFESSPYGYPEQMNTQADAQTQALANSGSGGNQNGYPYQDIRSGAPYEFEAEGQRSDKYRSTLSPGYSGGYSNAAAQGKSNAAQLETGYSSAEAQLYAQANKESKLGDQSELLDDNKAERMGAGSTNAFAGATARAVAQHELIIPNRIPGGSNVITCTRDYELHTLWSPVFDCMVCVCVREGWSLNPVCVSCSTCLNPPQPQPLPLPPQPPQPPSQFPPRLPSQILPVPAVPESGSQVSCAPLPTGTPFQNPLNPCQICICSNSFDIYGQPDVQIQCEEDPKCLPSPDDIISIPPIPETPQPVPMPLCERFPPDIAFPHPTDRCKRCKCIVEPQPFGIPEQKIICMQDPACEIPDNVPIPQPIPPIPEPIPSLPELIPRPLPPIIPEPAPEPIPWPPIVPLPSRPPSPLPGPPPHDTCKPYPPNQPFQHPWDECQVCVCSEIYGHNVVNIEVNCYTKPSCCVEPPIPGTKPLQLPHIVPQPPNNVIYIEPKCRYRQPDQPFVVDCNVCTCHLIYQYVIAECIPQPNCNNGIQYLEAENSAEALAQANAQSNAYGSQSYADALASVNAQSSQAAAAAQAQAQGYGMGGSYGYGSSSADAQAMSNALAGYGPQNQASSSALAEALANSGNQYPYGANFPSGSSGYSSAEADAYANAHSSGFPSFGPFGNSYPYSPDVNSQSSAQAESIANTQYGGPSSYNIYPSPLGRGFEAQSVAQAQAQAEAMANAQSGGISPYGYPYSPSGGESNAQAQAEAIANAQSGGSSPYGYPYSPGGDQSTAQAQAEAIANAQSGGVSSYGYPYSPGGEKSSAQAQAEAIANAQTGGISPYGYPYSPGREQSSAQAQAEAIANAQSGGISPYGYPYSPGGGQSNAQAQAEAIANAQSGGISPYAYPYTPGGGQSNAQAQAEAIANAQSSGVSPYGGYPYSLGGGQSSTQAQSEAVAASQMYPNLYPAPGQGLVPLYQPGINAFDSGAQAQAQAQAQALGASQGLSYLQSQNSITPEKLAQTSAMSGRPVIRSGRGLCQYSGDKYHHNCQACYCFSEDNGNLYTMCLGNPCA